MGSDFENAETTRDNTPSGTFLNKSMKNKLSIIKCEREDPRIHSGDESEPNI